MQNVNVKEFYREAITEIINREQIIHHGELVPEIIEFAMDKYGNTTLNRVFSDNIVKLSEVISEMVSKNEIQVIEYITPNNKGIDGHPDRVKRIIFHPKATMFFRNMVLF